MKNVVIYFLLDALIWMIATGLAYLAYNAPSKSCPEVILGTWCGLTAMLGLIGMGAAVHEFITYKTDEH